MNSQPTLMTHQIEAADFLAARPMALLADEAGAGKTASTVAACDKIGAKRILVCCPAALRENWKNEFDTWGNPDSNRELFVVSHESIALASESDLQRVQFDVIIVDESHRLRSFQARRTARFYGSTGLCMKSAYLWTLSGTPIVNSAADLYPFFHGGWVRAGVAPMGWLEFCQKFTSLVPDAWSGQKPVGLRNAGELADRLRNVFLRRTLDEVGVILPRLDVHRISFDLPEGVVATILKDLDGWSEQKFLEALEMKDEIRDTALQRARRGVGTAKVEALIPLISASNLPAVIFYVHKDVRDAYRSYLGANTPVIDGETSRDKLKTIQLEFKLGLHPYLLVQMQAGGVGLTLTTACDVIVGELPWTAAELWQAIKRVHRITQVRNVRAAVPFANNCWLDRVLIATIDRKHKASENFLRLLKYGE